MATNIEIDNFSALNVKNKLILSTAIASGLTSIPVVDSLDVIADDYMILGNLDSEFSEAVRAAHTGFAPDRNHVVLSAASAAVHNQFDPLWVLFGDKIKVWRAPNVDGTTPADGTFTLNSTIAISPDQPSTSFSDPTGSSSYWYKITYLNSITNTETQLSDSPIIIRGGSYGYYTTIENIRREAGFVNNQYVTDTMIDSQRYRAQFEIDGALQGLYSVPFQTPINPQVAWLTEKLAAAKLLSIDYGAMASGNSKDADKKMTEFNDLMTKIDNKSIVLTDQNGNEMAISGAGGNKAFPNTSTDTLPVDQGGSTRTFRMGMRF